MSKKNQNYEIEKAIKEFLDCISRIAKQENLTHCEVLQKINFDSFLKNKQRSNT